MATKQVIKKKDSTDCFKINELKNPLSRPVTVRRLALDEEE